MTRGFIPKHGGYMKLLSYQKAEIVYDATVYFCDRFIDRRSRTHDQMVQAARSGKQNIIEGSMASATSKETEIKLTNVARASLEELLADYRDFLRVRGFKLWEKDSKEALFVRRLGSQSTADKTDGMDGTYETNRINGINGTNGTDETDGTDETNETTPIQSSHKSHKSYESHESPMSHPATSTQAQASRNYHPATAAYATYRPFIETRPPEVVANLIICLIHQANYLLDRQIKQLEQAFLKEGGLRERMTRARLDERRKLGQ